MEHTVANTILSQLGNKRFLLMTGAKNFVAGENSLTFSLPNKFAKDGINSVVISLNSMDLYDITFSKDAKELQSTEHIYCDMLQETFTLYTGLQTRL